MADKAPGTNAREGISLLQLAEMFPSEESVTKWFESIRWQEDRPFPRCGDCDTVPMKNGKLMPYRCRGCRKFFSVRTGSVMERSHIPLKKWVWAIFLSLTSLKGVSSMKLHRDLGFTQQSAWFMAHRLREVFVNEHPIFSGPVEAHETYMGGKRRNLPKAKGTRMEGRGAVGKTVVVAAKDRPTRQVSAKVVPDTMSETLSRFVMEHVKPGAKIYADEAKAYTCLPNQEAVQHSAVAYVRGQVHSNGVKSLWSMLKRAHAGTFQKLSPQHLQRYINEFAGRHNLRNLNTIDQMREVVARMIGLRLMCRDLVGR